MTSYVLKRKTFSNYSEYLKKNKIKVADAEIVGEGLKEKAGRYIRSKHFKPTAKKAAIGVGLGTMAVGAGIAINKRNKKSEKDN